MKRLNAAFDTGKKFIQYLILPVLILIIWQIVCDRGIVSPTSMASPARLIQTVQEEISKGTFLQNIWTSFVRVMEGFLLALIASLSLGILIGLSRTAERVTKLVLQILKPIPPIAWIPLAILWFGIGEPSKIYIIFYGAFFPMLINTVDGIHNIDPKYLELAKVYEIERFRLIRKIILPGALPSILSGVRVGLGNAWVSVVAAEMIAATRGIGYMLSNGRSLSRPDWVILAMLLIGIVGKFMDDFLSFIFSKVMRWKAEPKQIKKQNLKEIEKQSLKESKEYGKERNGHTAASLKKVRSAAGTR